MRTHARRAGMVCFMNTPAENPTPSELLGTDSNVPVLPYARRAPGRWGSRAEILLTSVMGVAVGSMAHAMIVGAALGIVVPAVVSALAFAYLISRRAQSARHLLKLSMTFALSAGVVVPTLVSVMLLRDPAWWLTELFFSVVSGLLIAIGLFACSSTIMVFAWAIGTSVRSSRKRGGSGAA